MYRMHANDKKKEINMTKLKTSIDIFLFWCVSVRFQVFCISNFIVLLIQLNRFSDSHWQINLTSKWKFCVVRICFSSRISDLLSSSLLWPPYKFIQMQKLQFVEWNKIHAVKIQQMYAKILLVLKSYESRRYHWYIYMLCKFCVFEFRNPVYIFIFLLNH